MKPERDENLKDLLQALGSEQQVLAKCEAAGIPRAVLKRLRDGTRHATEFPAIHELAKLLGVDVARVDRAVTVRRRGSPRQF